MLYVVIAFLFLAVLLYVLLGGADFGAGIIEMFTSDRNKDRTRIITYRAIGPVWESNHMWLVILVVILFVGFPEIYTTVSIYLHIPLLIMLLGIIARGTAFIFRHYDAVQDRFQFWYNKIFVYSSFITPLFLGIIAGAILQGNIEPHASGFYAAFIAPWLTLFCLSVGLFMVALCGFLASIYLIGVAAGPYDRTRFVYKAGVTNLLAIAAGVCVFLSAWKQDIPLGIWIFGNPVSRYALVAASASLILLWYQLLRGKTALLRVLAGFQVTMVLLSILYHHFPDILILKHHPPLSLLKNTAPESTLRALGWALLGGSLLILPFLGYLFYRFEDTGEIS